MCKLLPPVWHDARIRSRPGPWLCWMHRTATAQECCEILSSLVMVGAPNKRISPFLKPTAMLIRWPRRPHGPEVWHRSTAVTPPLPLPLLSTTIGSTSTWSVLSSSPSNARLAIPPAPLSPASSLPFFSVSHTRIRARQPSANPTTREPAPSPSRVRALMAVAFEANAPPAFSTEPKSSIAVAWSMRSRRMGGLGGTVSPSPSTQHSTEPSLPRDQITFADPSSLDSLGDDATAWNESAATPPPCLKPDDAIRGFDREPHSMCPAMDPSSQPYITAAGPSSRSASIESMVKATLVTRSFTPCQISCVLKSPKAGSSESFPWTILIVLSPQPTAATTLPVAEAAAQRHDGNPPRPSIRVVTFDKHAALAREFSRA